MNPQPITLVSEYVRLEPIGPSCARDLHRA